MGKDVRIAAGFGNPPNKYTNQRAESMNNVLKEALGNRYTDQSAVHDLVYQKVVTPQEMELIKANYMQGEYLLPPGCGTVFGLNLSLANFGGPLQSWLDVAEIVDCIESKQKRLNSPHGHLESVRYSSWLSPNQRPLLPYFVEFLHTNANKILPRIVLLSEELGKLN
jgi:hypothetical protein